MLFDVSFRLPGSLEFPLDFMGKDDTYFGQKRYILGNSSLTIFIKLN